LRHARAVVVADGEAGCLPAAFSEAVTLGTPVAMAGSPVTRETLTADELAAAEYFDADGNFRQALDDFPRYATHNNNDNTHNNNDTNTHGNPNFNTDRDGNK
jgi:hypothetical protein